MAKTERSGASRGAPGSAERVGRPQPPHVTGEAANLLRLQRSAGNHAVVGLLASSSAVPGPLVQRLRVTPSDLDRAGDRVIAGFFGFGQSPYAVIRNALADYEEAKAAVEPGDERLLQRLLTHLEELCNKFLKTDTGADGGSRRRVIQVLVDDLAREHVALSQSSAQQKYLGNLGSTDAEDPHRAPLLTDAAKGEIGRAMGGFEADIAALKAKGKLSPAEKKKLQALEARMKLVNEKGLTEAEHFAIMAYTLEDFGYMNPATANSRTWMESALAENPYIRSALRNTAAPTRATDGKGHRGGEREFFQSDEEYKIKTIREEGALMSSLAIKGLQKLDPFEGVTYRGETTTEAAFLANVVEGEVRERPNLGSTAKTWGAPLTFAAGNISATKDIALFWVIDHPAGGRSGGRDIQALSVANNAEKEGEVLFLPGSPRRDCQGHRTGRRAGPARWATRRLHRSDRRQRYPEGRAKGLCRQRTGTPEVSPLTTPPGDDALWRALLPFEP